MGESRLIVEELLTLCLQRITMEESTINTELGERPWCRPGPSEVSLDPGSTVMFVLFLQR